MRSYSRHELTSKEPVKVPVLVTIIQVAIFLGLALSFSYPALQGNVLKQHDTEE